MLLLLHSIRVPRAWTCSSSSRQFLILSSLHASTNIGRPFLSCGRHLLFYLFIFCTAKVWRIRQERVYLLDLYSREEKERKEPWLRFVSWRELAVFLYCCVVVFCLCCRCVMAAAAARWSEVKYAMSLTTFVSSRWYEEHLLVSSPCCVNDRRWCWCRAHWQTQTIKQTNKKTRCYCTRWCSNLLSTAPGEA